MTDEEKAVEFLTQVCGGNPGALQVACALMKSSPEALAKCLKLGLTGSRLWVAYKDWAECDLDALAVGILDSDPKMLAVVNQECGAF